MPVEIAHTLSDLPKFKPDAVVPFLTKPPSAERLGDPDALDQETLLGRARGIRKLLTTTILSIKKRL
jgi:hypothetical protein